jgi:hypothetical protein
MSFTKDTNFLFIAELLHKWLGNLLHVVQQGP